MVACFRRHSARPAGRNSALLRRTLFALAVATCCHVATVADSDPPPFVTPLDFFGAPNLYCDKSNLGPEEIVGLFNEEPIPDYNYLENPPLPAHIYVTLAIDSISELSQTDQSFRLKGDIFTFHLDCRLTFWELLENNLTKTPYVFSGNPDVLKHLWLPKPRFTNEKEYDSVSGARNDGNIQCWVSMNGVVACVQPFAGRFTSKLDFKRMPYDTQMLHVDLMADERSTARLLHWADPAQPIAAFDKPISALRMSGWSLEVNQYAIEENYTSPLAWNSDFPTLTTGIRVKRDSYEYEMNDIIPAILYWFLSYLGFFLPQEAVPARAATGVIPILMLLNLSSRVNDSFPSLDYLPFLSEFILVTTILSVLNFATYTASFWAIRYLPKFEAKYQLILQRRNSAAAKVDAEPEEESDEEVGGGADVEANGSGKMEQEHVEDLTAPPSSMLDASKSLEKAGGFLVSTVTEVGKQGVGVVKQGVDAVKHSPAFMKKRARKSVIVRDGYRALGWMRHLDSYLSILSLLVYVLYVTISLSTL